MPKRSDTRRPCKVGMRVYNNLPQPPPYISFLGVAEDYCILSLLYTSQDLLVSLLFGMVSSLHPSSFLMIFYTCIYICATSSGHINSTAMHCILYKVCPSISDMTLLYIHCISKVYSLVNDSLC